MISRTWSRKSIAFAVAIAVLSVSSMVALASPGQTKMSGELSVSGQVTVNGTSAISGATVFSDSTVQTAANSSAVVNKLIETARAQKALQKKEGFIIDSGDSLSDLGIAFYVSARECTRVKLIGRAKQLASWN